jgi:hypothetical protein
MTGSGRAPRFRKERLPVQELDFRLWRCMILTSLQLASSYKPIRVLSHTPWLKGNATLPTAARGLAASTNARQRGC